MGYLKLLVSAGDSKETLQLHSRPSEADVMPLVNLHNFLWKIELTR